MHEKNFVLYWSTSLPLVGLALHFSFTLYTYPPVSPLCQVQPIQALVL